jgi:alpha-maltose-1-phosphate synthase
MKFWLPHTRGGSGADVFTLALAAALRQRGHQVVCQAFPHNLQYAPWLLRATRLPKNTQITIANTWNAFAFKRRGTPLIAIEHLVVLDPALRAYKSRYQAIFHNTLVHHFEQSTRRAADVLVAVSQYSAHAYRNAFGTDVDRIILNGIDTAFFTPPLERTPPDSERPFRLLYVGNMTRRKGADLLPEIMGRLGSGFTLFYTSGIRTNDPMAPTPNMQTLGRLNHEQLREQYRLADALILPSRLEGLSLTAMEAMACGLPIVAANTTSFPELINDGEHGRLCPKDDVPAFANAVRALAEDRRQTQLMGDAARERATAAFSLERMAAEYERLSAKLLSTRSTHGAV